MTTGTTKKWIFGSVIVAAIVAAIMRAAHAGN
jgi:hypothetical protein